MEKVEVNEDKTMGCAMGTLEDKGNLRNKTNYGYTLGIESQLEKIVVDVGGDEIRNFLSNGFKASQMFDGVQEGVDENATLNNLHVEEQGSYKVMYKLVFDFNDNNKSGSYSNLFTGLSKDASNSSALLMNIVDIEIKGIATNVAHESIPVESKRVKELEEILVGEVQEYYTYWNMEEGDTNLEEIELLMLILEKVETLKLDNNGDIEHNVEVLVGLKLEHNSAVVDRLQKSEKEVLGLKKTGVNNVLLEFEILDMSYFNGKVEVQKKLPGSRQRRWRKLIQIWILKDKDKVRRGYCNILKIRGGIKLQEGDSA
ncbi:hypothetical protein ACH5RR_013303 [Cinchona calisaya]|uniref:Uncharacterized protein n=1 Tax=Cinchona calisaya TaxID=153742 RepID=A0ABD2ZZP2_9GENT